MFEKEVMKKICGQSNPARLVELGNERKAH